MEEEERAECNRTARQYRGMHVMEEGEQAEVAVSTETERNQRRDREKVMKPVEFTTCLLIV